MHGEDVGSLMSDMAAGVGVVRCHTHIPVHSPHRVLGALGAYSNIPSTYTQRSATKLAQRC